MRSVEDIAGDILTEFAEYSHWSFYYDEVYLSKLMPHTDYKTLAETLIELKSIMFRMIEKYQSEDNITVENVPDAGFTLHHLSNQNTPTSKLRKNRYPFYQLIKRLEKEGKFNPEDRLDLVMHPEFFYILDGNGNLISEDIAYENLGFDLDSLTNKNQ